MMVVFVVRLLCCLREVGDEPGNEVVFDACWQEGLGIDLGRGCP